MPNARPRSGALEAAGDEGERPGDEQAPAAPWRSRKTISHSSVGARPHSAEVTAKLASPIV